MAEGGHRQKGAGAQNPDHGKQGAPAAGIRRGGQISEFRFPYSVKHFVHFGKQSCNDTTLKTNCLIINSMAKKKVL